MDNKGKRHIGLQVSGAIVGTACISVYIGAAAFFSDSFYFNTSINDMNIGGKTVNQVEQLEKSKGKQYVLKLEGRKGAKGEIKGEAIDLHYEFNTDINPLKDQQNAFIWPLGTLMSQELKAKEEVTYNETKLNEAITALEYFKKENVIAPQNATLEYVQGKYEIISGEIGNTVNKETFYKEVIGALQEGKTKLNLEEAGCYQKADFTENSEGILRAKEVMNKYSSAKIVYTFGKRQEVVNGELIKDWLKLDEDCKVQLDEEKVKDYIGELASKYNTLGITRQFKASSGKKVQVSGGDYGWAINQQEEAKRLIKAIKEGAQVTTEPVSTVKSLVYGENKIGNSYVEISLTKQYLWFYKEGKLVVKGSVVTGNQSTKHSTPQGTYKLKYKQRNAVLRGPGYAAPVSFWMPFNQDIGIHDATWRSRFGGNIYTRNGSHGCVNVPYSMAKAIFYEIDESIPIICYYD